MTKKILFLFASLSLSLNTALAGTPDQSLRPAPVISSGLFPIVPQQYSNEFGEGENNIRPPIIIRSGPIRRGDVRNPGNPRNDGSIKPIPGNSSSPGVNPRRPPRVYPNPGNPIADGDFVEDNGYYDENNNYYIETPKEFQCNIFDNEDYSSLLSAINIISQVMNVPSCYQDENGKDTKVSDNLTKIKDAIRDIQKNLKNEESSNPDTLSPEISPEDRSKIISEKVDEAILAANAVAMSFAKNKNCQSQGTGQFAVGLSKLVNGLVPLALKAATATGQNQVIPFILGGQVITNAITSVGKIMAENQLKIDDPLIRRAILENTCQFIKIDRRHKFLLQDRSRQVEEITRDLNETKKFYSAQFNKLPSNIKSSINTDVSLDKNIKDVLSKATDFKMTLDEIKSNVTNLNDKLSLCTLGMSLYQEVRENRDFPKLVFSNLDNALAIQPRASRISANALRLVHEKSISSIESIIGSNSLVSKQTQCASITSSWLNAINDALSITIKIASKEEHNLNKKLSENADYKNWLTSHQNLDKKKILSDVVLEAVDNIKQSQNIYARGEVNIELAKLRATIFESNAKTMYVMNAPSPAEQWLNYQLTRGEFERNEFSSIYNMLFWKSRKYLVFEAQKHKMPWTTKAEQELDKNARELKGLRISSVEGSPAEHRIICNELNTAWGHWVAMADHVASSELYCTMISEYLLESVQRNSPLVDYCLGFEAGFSTKRSQSKITRFKSSLLFLNLKKEANIVAEKRAELYCDPNR